MPRKLRPKEKSHSKLWEMNVYEFISYRLGISKEIVAQVLRALHEYILVQLCKRGEVYLLKLGTFRLGGGVDRLRVNFQPANSLKSDLKQVREINSESANIDYPLDVALLNVASKDIKVTGTLDKTKLQKPTRLYQNIKEISQSLRTTEVNPVELEKQVDKHYIQYHLLCYLQSHFIYQESWIHPHTQRVVSWEQAKQALILLREFDPLGYRVIYMMWISIEGRDKKLKEWGYTPQGVIKKLYTTMNTLLLLLLGEELLPKELDNYVAKLEEKIRSENRGDWLDLEA